MKGAGASIFEDRWSTGPTIQATQQTLRTRQHTSIVTTLAVGQLQRNISCLTPEEPILETLGVNEQPIALLSSVGRRVF